MSDDEVDELLKAVDTSSGEINYTGILLIRYISPVWKHLADKRCLRPRPDHPRQLRRLSLSLSPAPFPDSQHQSSIHILQALLLLFSLFLGAGVESRPGLARPGTGHVCPLSFERWK